MEDLLDTIERLKKEKESKKIEPLVISFLELQNERLVLMKKELNQLYKDKKIGMTKLINGIGIK